MNNKTENHRIAQLEEENRALKAQLEQLQKSENASCRVIGCLSDREALIKSNELLEEYTRKLIIEKERFETLGNNLHNIALYQFVYNTKTYQRHLSYLSGTWEAVTGIPANVILNDVEAVLKIIHPDDLPLVLQQIAHCAITLDTFYVEFRAIVNGRIRWGQITSHFHRDGDLIVGDGIVIDITSRKETECRQTLFTETLQTLHLEEDMTKAINMTLAEVGKYTNVSRVFIFEKNEDGTAVKNTFEWCNEGITPCKDALQAVPIEIAQPWFDMFDANEYVCTSDINTTTPKIAKVLNEQDIKAIIVLPLTINGVHCGFIGFDECTCNKEWSMDDVTLLRSVSQTISSAMRRHQAESNLRLVNRRQGILNEVLQMLYSTENFPKALNTALVMMGEYTGVSRVYIFEKSADGTAVSNTYEWCNEGVIPAIDSLQNIPFEKVQTWFDAFDAGEYICTDNINTLSPTVAEDLAAQDIKSIVVIPLTAYGNNYGFIGFDECNFNRVWDMEDVTLLRNLSQIISSAKKRHQSELELLHAKEKAEESDNLKTSFLANMSHEIRTPLNGIVGLAQILDSETLTGDERKEYTHLIGSCCNQLVNLINDIIVLSQIEAKQMTICPAPVHINNFMEEMHLFFETYMQTNNKGNIELILDRSGFIDNYIVYIDSTRLHQVLSNLLNNAIKFTQEGHIRFGYRQTAPDTLEFMVEDTGIGLKPEYKEVIFERFRQLELTDTRQYGGAGLGLSISRSLVQLMGGNLWIESTEGKGSTFYFTVATDLKPQL